MKILNKISTAEGIIQFLERLLRWAPPVFGTFLSSGLTGWAVTATAAFDEYSPASWVLGGLFGASLFVVTWFMWASARLKLVKYEYAKDFAKRLQSVNPLDRTFTKHRIDINIFRTPTHDVVEGKVFVDCELRGPAVVLFMGYTNFSHASFIRCEMVRVKVGVDVYNVIPFKDLTVRGGKLCNLTILIPESDAASIPVGAHWITPQEER